MFIGVVGTHRDFFPYSDPLVKLLILAPFDEFTTRAAFHPITMHFVGWAFNPMVSRIEALTIELDRFAHLDDPLEN
jgi:hypothetical protein